MDSESFDRLTRLLGAPGTRRSALAALLGVSLAGTAGITDAAKKGKGKNRNTGKKKDRKKDRKKAPGPAPAAAGEAPSLAAEAVICEPPSDGANMSGCNYNNRNLARFDLSGSKMVGTSFRGTNLCGANLSSSQLKNADFRGNAANVTNLTLADLHSSGCNGTLDNDRTIYCRTITCSGAISNRDCPINPADVACCIASDCPDIPGPVPSGLIDQTCLGNRCCVGSGTVIGLDARFGVENGVLCNLFAQIGRPCQPDSICCTGATTGGTGDNRRCT